MNEYSTKFSFIRPSVNGPTFANCTICKNDLNIAHGGIDDIRKHIATQKHKKNFECVQKCPSVMNFMQKADEAALAAIKAEVIHSLWLVENNLPIATADTSSKTLKRMFPDSQLANKFACGRTKTTAIVKTLAYDRTSSLINIIRNNPFALSTDGSNDDLKLYPIVVRVFNYNNNQRISANLLSLPNLDGASTGQNIAVLIKEELNKKNVPFKNMIGFGTDNTASMVGKNKGCSKFLQDESKDLAIMGCPCHLLAIAGEKASKILPANVEELLIDIYYFLDKSAKRKQTLRKFQTLYSSSVHKILKHVSTRWLSLGACIERLLEQWTALTHYFNEEGGTEQRYSLYECVCFTCLY